MNNIIKHNVNIIGVEPSRRNLEVFKTKPYSKIKMLIEKALIGSDMHIDEIDFTEFVGKNGKFHQWNNTKGNYIKNATCRKEFIGINKYKVKTITINTIIDMIKLFGKEKIDYLKMDIEGNELEVIFDMDQEIAKKIVQMSFEFHYPKKEDLMINILKTKGFNNVIKFSGNEIYASRNQS